MVTVTCAGCGRQFEARRRDARTCSASCRKRAQRAAHRALDDATTAHRRRDRDRKRADRAAAKVSAAADRPAAPALSCRSTWLPRSTPRVCHRDAGGARPAETHADTCCTWQREFLQGVEALRHGGRLSALSVAARLTGKTTLLATVAAAGVDGPLVAPRAAVLLVAASFQQALIGFDHARAFLQETIDADPERWRVNRSESVALIQDRETGAELRAREANARTLHGSAPVLMIADEPAQWLPTQRDAIYSALRSRLGKVPGARLVAIGTRPDDAQHWFARLLGRGGSVYAAAPDADPFLPATWGSANPSLAHFPALRAVYRREADEARADPSLLPAFKALRLNLGTADHEIHVLIDAERWQACECELLPARTGPMVLAFDLSGGDAMAAAVAYWPQGGRLEALAAFPALPSLGERGRTDGADYERMAADGDLLVIGRRVVPVAELVDVALRQWGHPARIVADARQQRELREALEAADVARVPLVISSLGGYMDGPGRVRDFRRMVNGGRVWCAPALLIRQSMTNARVIEDSMGEPRVIKGGQSGRRRTARDDVAVAIAAAVSEGARMPTTPRRRRHYVA